MTVRLSPARNRHDAHAGGKSWSRDKRGPPSSSSGVMAHSTRSRVVRRRSRSAVCMRACNA
eukprot:scaffold74071_cov63-Phaeocystis_antarctica.AAC.4